MMPTTPRQSATIAAPSFLRRALLAVACPVVGTASGYVVATVGYAALVAAELTITGVGLGPGGWPALVAVAASAGVGGVPVGAMMGALVAFVVSDRDAQR